MQKTVANVGSLAEQVAQAEARADELAQQLSVAKANEEAAKNELSASEQTFAESLATAETQVAQLQTQLDAKASTDSTVVQVTNSVAKQNVTHSDDANVLVCRRARFICPV